MMKKTFQRTLSLALALILALSFAGVSLAVGSEATVTVQLLLADQAGATGHAATADDFGSSPTVSFQGEHGADQATGSVAELQSNGLYVTPPAGFGIDSLYLAADPGFVPGSGDKSLTALAEIDSQTHTVTVPAAVFYDGQLTDNRGENFGAVFHGDAGSYTLFVTFVRLSAANEVRVRYDSGEAYLGGDLVNGGNEVVLRYASDADSSVPPENGIQTLVVADLLPGVEENAGRRFLGWKLVYANGAAIDVAPGTALVPYTSATLIAQWGESISSGGGDVINMGDAPSGFTETVHQHNMTYHEAVAGNCTTPGNIEYYSCDGCGKLFADEAGTQEITPESTVVYGGHNLEHHDAIPATEQSDGYYEYWQCTACNRLFYDADANFETTIYALVIPQLVHQHTMTKHDAVPGSCTTPGSIEYWSCDSCQKLFADEAGMQEITLEGTVAYGGHTLEHHEAVAATEQSTGSYEYWQCTACGKLFSDADGLYETTADALVIPQLAHQHTMTFHDAVAGNCTTPGNIAYYSCDGCQKLFADEAGTQEITLEGTVAYGGHVLEHHDAVPATEQSAGSYEYWQCTACNRLFYDADANFETTADALVIPQLVHQHTLTKHDAVPGNCTTPGNIEYYSCDGCGKLFADAEGSNEITLEGTVAYGGHTLEHHDAVAATEQSAGSIEYWQCTVCSKLFSDSDATQEISAEMTVVPQLSHQHTLDKVDAKSASCTATGNIEYWTCSGCGKLFSDAEGLNEISTDSTVIPMTEHSWDAGVVTQEPTETAEGVRTYTCSSCFTTRTEAIPALTPAPTVEPTAEPTAAPTAAPTAVPAPSIGSDIKITEALSNAGITTVQQVTDLMNQKAQSLGCGAVTLYDVTIPAGTSFPLSITLPYPQGVDTSADFKVLHMIAEGPSAGTIEELTASKSSSGLTVTVNSASPFAVATVPTVTNYTLKMSGNSSISVTVDGTTGKVYASKTYDGTALIPTGDMFTISDANGNTVSGYTFTVSYSPNANPTTVTGGSVDITYNVTELRDASGNVVPTNRYTVSPVTATLSITKRPLTLSANSANKVYDGNALTLTAPGYTVTGGSLAAGESITAISVTGSQTQVGSSQSTITTGSTVIKKADGTETTSNYQITLNPGTLEVTTQPVTPITVSVGNVSKVYDGTALTLSNSNVQLVSGTLPAGSTISAAFSTASRTAAGSDVVNITSISIRDAAGADITNNYSINRQSGTLTVTKRPLTIETFSNNKVYDGRPLTNMTTPAVTGRLDGDQISLKITGSQTNIGSSRNTISDVKITHAANQQDVTSNYEITYKLGTLTVTDANGMITTPRTGDESNLMLWIVLMVVALVLAVVVILILKRSRKPKKRATRKQDK